MPYCFRSYYKLLCKIERNIKRDRIFVTINPLRKNGGIWYKNFSVGINEINKQMKKAAEHTGLDIKLSEEKSLTILYINYSVQFGQMWGWCIPKNENSQSSEYNLY